MLTKTQGECVAKQVCYWSSVDGNRVSGADGPGENVDFNLKHAVNNYYSLINAPLEIESDGLCAIALKRQNIVQREASGKNTTAVVGKLESGAKTK
jgi:hypothetical protein